MQVYFKIWVPNRYRDLRHPSAAGFADQREHFVLAQYKIDSSYGMYITCSHAKREFKN